MANGHNKFFWNFERLIHIWDLHEKLTYNKNDAEKICGKEKSSHVRVQTFS